MKILIDVKDEKALYILQLLKDLPYVKAKPLTAASAKVLEELKIAVDNMILISTGKLKPRPVQDLIDEL